MIYNLALRYKFFVLSDDIYELFFYDINEPRITPLFFSSDEILSKSNLHRKEILRYNPENNPYVISLNSFNKLINPGMRIGWILADTSIINQLINTGWIASGGGVCNTMGHIVRSYMQLGFMDQLIDATKKDFSLRIKKCDSILKGSKFYTYDYPRWGYFFWIKLNDHINLEKVKKELSKEDLHVLFGDNCVSEEAAKEERFQFLKRRIRVCFVRYPIEIILDALQILRDILESLDNNTKF